MSVLYPLLLQAALLGTPATAAALPAPAARPAEDFDTRLRLARDLATSGDPAQRAQALALYDAMLLESPGNSDVLLARGRTQAWMGRHAEAEHDLRAVVLAKPGYADAWSALGDLYLWSDRPRQAVDAYAAWVALVPDAPAPLIARGRAYRAAGDSAAARADFTAAGSRGADPAEVAGLLASTQPQQAVADAMREDGYRWQLRAGLDYTGFNRGRDAWTDTSVSLRRKFTRGSLALEGLQADHFRQRDMAWALDGYVSLWNRAYANARYQRGPASGILARNAWRVELFQGAGSGWELSASGDHLQFGTGTTFYGVGVGRYVGNWYARYKLQHVPGVGAGSWSHRGVLRNYYRGNADDYLEVSAGHGRSVDLDRSGALVRNSNAWLGVSWVRYVGRNWGVKLGLGYADDADGIHERQLSVALYRRW